ncbi:MAG TPA: hypothetical protein V6D26_05240 [Stenomitos sp.]
MEPKAIVEEFFNIYSSGQIERSIDFIASTNSWMERATDSLEQLKSQLRSLESMIGDYYGYHLMAEKTLGNSLVGFSYIANFDRQPIRFIFVFYKATDQWKIHKINFDMDLDDELAEFVKQSMFM